MITSVSNPQVKNLLALIKKAKERKKQQCYVVEGVRMLKEAPKEEMAAMYVSASFAADPAHAALLDGHRFEVLSDAVFSHISDTQTPQGVLCLMRMKERTPDITCGVWLVLENIQDPGNLGTMLRTGEAAGITGVIMDRTTVDIYNPKTIRSTMGSIFRVPFVVVDDLSEAIAQLKKTGHTVYAADLQGSVSYDVPDYTTGAAFLIGNEGNGLRPETAACADTHIRIPMDGQVESLNAAMAAGILLYEARRQRG